jgi:hypothetical protein
MSALTATLSVVLFAKAGIQKRHAGTEARS